MRPQPLGNENMTAAPSGLFATGDGPLNIAANQQQQFETLARLIGRPELAADPRFADREDRKRNRFALKAEIEAALAAKSAREWSALFNAQGVPAGEVLDIPDVLEHPQVTERELVKTFEGAPGVEKPVSVVRSGFRLKKRRPRARLAAAGARGGHGRCAGVARVYGETRSRGCGGRRRFERCPRFRA